MPSFGNKRLISIQRGSASSSTLDDANQDLDQNGAKSSLMGGDNSVQAGGVDILKVTPNNIEIL